MEMEQIVAYLGKASSFKRETGLTGKKLRERGRIIEDPEHPEYVVFEVERHHSVLGMPHISGEAMRAMLTIYKRYGISKETHEFADLGQSDDYKIFYHSDDVVTHHTQDCSFTFHRTPDGNVKIEEVMANFEKVFSDISELHSVMEEYYAGWDLSIYYEELNWYLPEEEANKIMHRFEEDLFEGYLEKAQAAWERQKEFFE